MCLPPCTNWKHAPSKLICDQTNWLLIQHSCTVIHLTTTYYTCILCILFSTVWATVEILHSENLLWSCETPNNTPDLGPRYWHVCATSNNSTNANINYIQHKEHNKNTSIKIQYLILSLWWMQYHTNNLAENTSLLWFSTSHCQVGYVAIKLLIL